MNDSGGRISIGFYGSKKDGMCSESAQEVQPVGFRPAVVHVFIIVVCLRS